MKISCLLFLILTIPLSHASVSSIFGLGGRNMALGGAADLTDGQAYSAKGNPASLVNVDKSTVSLGYISSSLQLADPATVTASADPLLDDSYDVTQSDNLAGYTFGIGMPLSKRIAFGISGIMPANSFARVHAFTGNETTYLHFNDRKEAPEIYTSLGIRLPLGFSVGAGLLYSAKASGQVQMGLSDTDSQARMMLELQPDFVPMAGAMFQREMLGGEFLVGAAYRDEQAGGSDIKVDVSVDTGLGTLPFSATSQLVAFYEPAVLSLGVGYKNMHTGGTYLAVERNFWSQYKAPVINIGGDDLLVLTGGANDQYQISLQDSWSYRLGHEFAQKRLSKNVKIAPRIGVEYHTSALPDNPSSLAVIDSDRFVANAGMGLNIKRVGTLITIPFSVDLTAKWIALQDKKLTTIEGDSANVGGDIFSVMAGVNFEI